MRKRTVKKISPRVFVYSLVMTLVLYSAMIFVERTILKSEEYVSVYVAEGTVEKNTVVTAANIDELFALEERRADWLPDGSISDAAGLLGMTVKYGYEKNEVVTYSGLSAADTRMEGIENPVEVSLDAGSLSQVVGGIIREGDRINIWSVSRKNENGENIISAGKICDYAYVTRVFTSSGVQVKQASQDGAAATVVNIVIPGAKEEEFNIALESGTLRVGRCMYDREQKK